MNARGVDTFVGQPFALVRGYHTDSDQSALACFNGIEYEFADGDLYSRQGDALAGFPAEFLTLHQLEQRLGQVKDRDSEILSVMLWLLRRLPRAYGNPLSVIDPIRRLAKCTGIDVDDVIAERANGACYVEY